MGETKRTISPEHLAAMQAGRERAKNHQKRVSQLTELDDRLREAAQARDKPVRMRNKRRRKRR